MTQLFTIKKRSNYLASKQGKLSLNMDLRWADAIPTNLTGITTPYNCVMDFLQVNSNSPYGSYAIQVLKSTDGQNYSVVYTATVGTPSKTVTSMNAATDIVNVSDHGLVVDSTVQFDGTGVIAAPLDKLTTYYVRQVLNANTFTLSDSSGGSVIDLTSDSSGDLSVLYPNPNLNLYTSTPDLEFNQGDIIRLRFLYLGHTILDPVATIFLVEI